eukprot:885298-Pelagomonas_calceolata.AAC.1
MQGNHAARLTENDSGHLQALGWCPTHHHVKMGPDWYHFCLSGGITWGKGGGCWSRGRNPNLPKNMLRAVWGREVTTLEPRQETSCLTPVG